jgi:hypothetical protein
LKNIKKKYVYAIWAKRTNTITFEEFKHYILKPLVKNNPNYLTDHIYYGPGYIYLETPNQQDENTTFWIYHTVVKSQTFYEDMWTNWVDTLPPNAQRIEKILGGKYVQMMTLANLEQSVYISFLQQLLETDGKVIIPLICQYASYYRNKLLNQ